jgi:hypothetical protein
MLAADAVTGADLSAPVTFDEAARLAHKMIDNMLQARDLEQIRSRQKRGDKK